MATLPVTAEDEERERLQRDSALSPATSGGVSGGSTGNGGAPATGGTGGLGAPFVGLSSYLGANESTTRELGDRVVGNVEKVGADARSAIGRASDAFNARAGGGTVRTNQSILNRLGAGDASGLASDASHAAEFARMRDASYTGPRSLEGIDEYGDVATKLSSARETDELASSDYGLGALSDRAVTGPRTAGGRSLDTQLLRGDTGLQSRIGAARQGLASLAGERDAASTAAQTRAGEAKATTDKTRGDTRAALTAAQDAFDKSLNQRVDQNRLEAFYRGATAYDALGPNAMPIPTAGAQGRYYAGNDPTRGSYTDGAQAGNVPEFIHNTGGEALLPGFALNTAARDYERAGAPPSADVLQTLGMTAQQWHALTELRPVADMARSAASGTSNVNPYAYIEAFDAGLGDLRGYLDWTDPNLSITRDNVATAADYGNATGLATLAGPELSRTLLDPTRAGEAGTADLDIVDFDLARAQRARASTLEDLAGRTGAHVAGNARSGSDSILKRYGFIANPFDPRHYTDPGMIIGGGAPGVTVPGAILDYHDDPKNLDVDRGEKPRPGR